MFKRTASFFNIIALIFNIIVNSIAIAIPAWNIFVNKENLLLNTVLALVAVAYFIFYLATRESKDKATKKNRKKAFALMECGVH